jgi:gamma-glutamyltranspeptidase
MAPGAHLELSQWSIFAPEVSQTKKSVPVFAAVLPLPDMVTQIPISDMNAVTVPGAVAGWFKTHSEFGSGKLSMAEILAPAIRLAEEGVPTHEINSSMVIEMITRDS